jgi:hypothetical protein
MGAPQFFTEPADLVSDEAVLRGDEARHAASPEQPTPFVSDNRVG